jgi:integrase
MATKRRGSGEGSIFQRKDGRWVGQLDLGIVDSRRRYRTVYGKQRKEVAGELTKLLRQRDTGALTSAGRETVAGYAAAWLDGKKSSLRPSTRRSYAWLINTHLVPEIGSLRLDKLQPAHVRTMLQRRLDAGLSPRSVHHLRAVLRAALSQAVKDGILSRNVAALADGPTVEPNQVTPLSPDEAAQLLAAVHGDRLEALYRVALAIGLRRGEALGLRWQDVDLERRELHVVNALQRIDGKLRLVPPKTKRSGAPCRCPRSPSMPCAIIVSVRRRSVCSPADAGAMISNWCSPRQSARRSTAAW